MGVAAISVRTIRVMGVVAVLAAVMAIVADLALEFTPQHADLLTLDYRFFISIPMWRLLLGHFLGVAAIPVETIGFWLAYEALRPAWRRKALPVLLIGGYIAVGGVAFHGLSGVIALIVQAESNASGPAHMSLARLLTRTGAFTLPLAFALAVGLIAVSMYFAALVSLRPTLAPRWLAFCNPLTILMVIGVASVAIPPLALVLAPTALNLADAIFFGALTIALWNGGTQSINHSAPD